MDTIDLGDLDLKELADEAEKYFLTAAAVAAGAAIVERLFMPKPTKVVLDGDVPVQLYAVGKKGKRPQAVYVTTQKRQIHFKPAAMFLAGACVAELVKLVIDEKLVPLDKIEK